MHWQDTQVWLPTLLLSDSVMFPQCEVRWTMDIRGFEDQWEAVQEGSGVINVFWAPEREGVESNEVRVSHIGTICKLLITEQHEKPSSSPFTITLRGLYKVRCEGIREARQRLESRFRILVESMPARKTDWLPLLQEISAWLQRLDPQWEDNFLYLAHDSFEEMPDIFINRLCMELTLPSAIKQDLLELPDPYIRGRALCRLLEKTVLDTANNTFSNRKDVWIQ